ncbi:MAG: amidohydrolase family protein [Proteobacteria bacterium]|nr:amidohydrolase family protein [Pseudomonadota bacterium]
MYDLVIRNGLVIDGTGTARRRADVAIENGRVVAIGSFSRASARRALDAEGRVVAPGFVDPHTHYDPQLMFDPYAQSSCYHGVTSVVVGNCGFGLAPTRAADRESILQIFSRVEEMSLEALSAIEWDFESFPELLAAREGRLGVNAAYYLAHSNLRRFVMGEAAHERAATADEVGRMRALVRDAMQAGAAGLSSSHSPTDLDALDRPVPSRLSDHDELEALVVEVGRANRGSFAYLPFSAVGGLTPEDGALLIRLALASRVPVIIQGLGARSKVDAPTATWPESKRYLERARAAGAAIYSMLMARPFHRTFTLAAGTTLYEGVPVFHRLFTEAQTVPERCAMLRRPEYRDAIRHAVENPNRDPNQGSTLPPPRFDRLSVNDTQHPDHRECVGRTLTDIAKQRGIAPMDALVDIALADDLATEILWRTDDDEWRQGTYLASTHPQMIVGTSDGGAHLGRDDGAEFSSYFLRYWVREWGQWELEAAIRELTQLPAAILGLADRGVLAPGYAADVVIFDPDTVGPDRKEFRTEGPGGARWTSRPAGIHATIVNGTPIVLDGEIPDDCGTPGAVLRPGAPRHS